MQVGSVVWGTVRRVEPYGVFVGIEGTRFSGLLHISSISQAHVESVEVHPALIDSAYKETEYQQLWACERQQALDVSAYWASLAIR